MRDKDSILLENALPEDVVEIQQLIS